MLCAAHVFERLCRQAWYCALLEPEILKSYAVAEATYTSLIIVRNQVSGSTSLLKYAIVALVGEIDILRHDFLVIKASMHEMKPSPSHGFLRSTSDPPQDRTRHEKVHRRELFNDKPSSLVMEENPYPKCSSPDREYSKDSTEPSYSTDLVKRRFEYDLETAKIMIQTEAAASRAALQTELAAEREQRAVLDGLLSQAQRNISKLTFELHQARQALHEARSMLAADASAGGALRPAILSPSRSPWAGMEGRCSPSTVFPSELCTAGDQRSPTTSTDTGQCRAIAASNAP